MTEENLVTGTPQAPKRSNTKPKPKVSASEKVAWIGFLGLVVVALIQYGPGFLDRFSLFKQTEPQDEISKNGLIFSPPQGESAAFTCIPTSETRLPEELSVRRITHFKTVTAVDLRFDNFSEETSKFRFFPPGDQRAWKMVPLDKTKAAVFYGISGGGITAGGENRVDPGSSVEFTLWFERFDDATRVFDVQEMGIRQASPRFAPWRILKIRIPEPPAVPKSTP